MKFVQPCQLMKAEPMQNGAVKIKLKISSEALDKQNDIVLKSAFAKPETQTNFIKQGLYDYNHLSDILEAKCHTAQASELVELQLQKSRSIIGAPNADHTGLYVNEEGVFSEGLLIPEKEFVKEIIQGIKAGVPYGASISGFTMKSANSNVIDNVFLRKVAIQPLQESINTETYAQLAKSQIYSLTKILKGEIMDELIQPVVKSGDLQSHQIALMWDWFSNQPEIQERIAKEIMDGFRNKSLPMEYSAIRNHLCNAYAMDEPTASNLSNGILINLSPEDF